MSNLKLTSLEIDKYRAFGHLQVSQLGRVNLFVGRNSIGKTSLLEAIWLYARRGASTVIRDILTGRDESLLPLGAEAAEDAELGSSLRYLFYGRPQKITPGTSFSIRANNTGDMLSVMIQAYRLERDGEQGISRRVIITPEEYELEEQARLGLTVRFGEQLFSVRDLGLIFSRRGLSSAADSSENTVIMVPASGPTRAQIAVWRDRSIIEGKKHYVLRALNLIVPNVEDIDLVSGLSIDPQTRDTERIPVVKLHGIEEFIALRSLGDGMIRMFTLALALVNAQDGILLVDEIENGFHYSVQEKMWRLIMQIATEINAQVFAATHSKDCVDAFSAVTRTHPEEGVLIRLGQKKSKIIATIFDEEDLEAATDQNIEVR